MQHWITLVDPPKKLSQGGVFPIVPSHGMEYNSLQGGFIEDTAFSIGEIACSKGAHLLKEFSCCIWILTNQMQHTMVIQDRLRFVMRKFY